MRWNCTRILAILCGWPLHIRWNALCHFKSQAFIGSARCVDGKVVNCAPLMGCNFMFDLFIFYQIIIEFTDEKLTLKIYSGNL